MQSRAHECPWCNQNSDVKGNMITGENLCSERVVVVATHDIVDCEIAKCQMCNWKCEWFCL